MKWLLIIAVVMIGLHLLALAAGRRGWIYYSNNPAPPGAGSRAANTLAAFFEPEVEHVIEQELVVEEDESAGDP